MNVIACIKRETMMSEYIPHKHSDVYEIITNHIGSCIATVGGKQFKMEKNDILIVPPGTMHTAYSTDGFSDFFIAAKHLNYDREHIVNDTDNVVLSLMEMIYTAMLEKEDNYKRIADTLLDAICCYLDKYIKNSHKYQFVTDLKNVILENFIDPAFRLDQAIQKTGYNTDYMRRCFFSDTNKTPLQYLTDLRINRAKMLLLQNETESILSISERCGFRDSFYFSSVFKRHTGMPPKKYREFHTK